MGAALTTLVGTPIIVGKAFLRLKFVELAIRTIRYSRSWARLMTDPVIDMSVQILHKVVLLPLFSSFQALEEIAAKSLHLTRTQAAHDGHLAKTLMKIGSRAVDLYDKQHEASMRLATSGTVFSRMWCMAVGYAVVATTVCLIALAGEANLGRLSSGVVDQMKQHGKFLKLALFMALEMAVFPIVAGSAINLSLLPLFDGVSVATRLAQLRHTPFGIVFVNWIIGTRCVHAASKLLKQASCMAFRHSSLTFGRPFVPERYFSSEIPPTRPTRPSKTFWNAPYHRNCEK